ncbi:hypothetical protein CWB73_13580 [Pseudoalteromonas phenolica]|uniref:von Hippel-Lindau disease tumour suppressor beta domain-containing protein n=2 Tax=Pseudoalteromonas phenolica TaxID=161398 RepID=A0A4Q7IS55_9GAMM|nr:hypothetical protein C1E23_04030 [Pseudoalteromonas phenolica]TMN89579.1 hypothetical protein CWB72_11135 [Pseudoalteromonas phenolica]TMP79449.1 hypothetical protein CWB73_13580 [Pseudoalteromonas phenolica]
MGYEMKNIYLILTFLTLVSCASVKNIESANNDLSINSSKYKLALDTYMKKDLLKAFAIAVDDNGAFAFGYSFEYSNQQGADDRALKECIESRKMFKVMAQCSIYMRGNELYKSTKKSDCTSLGSLRSLNSAIETSLIFENGTHSEINIYWVDYDGEEVFYNSLKRFDSYTQQTYLKHPWVVRDQNGSCIAVVESAEL